MTIKNVGFDGSTLPIREFKLEDMADNPAIVIIAKRGSGKSWLCRKILKQYASIPCGLIIARTDRMNTFYGNFFPDSYIFYEYKTSILQKLIRRQEAMIEKRKIKVAQGKKLDTRAYIIMDDCMADKKAWIKEQPIQELFLNGRHYDLMYMLTMQAPLGIPPDLRKQFEYIFLFAEEFTNELKKLYEHYAGMFPNITAFMQVFKKVTEDFCCMVLVNTNRHKTDLRITGTFLDKIFWYKADNVNIGNFGCDQFRMLHKKNYDNNWRINKKTLNLDEFCNQKKRDKETIAISKLHDTDPNKPQSYQPYRRPNNTFEHNGRQ